MKKGKSGLNRSFKQEGLVFGKLVERHSIRELRNSFFKGEYQLIKEVDVVGWGHLANPIVPSVTLWQVPVLSLI